MAKPDIENAEQAAEAAAEQPDTKEKKKKEKKDKRERVRGQGGGAKAFIILFVVALLALLVAVIGFNAFNIRDKYLADSLRNVPILSNLLPPPELELEEGEAVISTEEYEQTISRLERELATALAQQDALQGTIERNNQEISRLRLIEGMQEQFRADKREFDEMLIAGDPGGFAAFFEKIAPETAEELYPQAKANAEREDEIQGFLAAISQQDEKAAAKMLEQLIPTDLDLVVEILKGLSNRMSGSILSEMSPANAAIVTKRWDPITY